MILNESSKFIISTKFEDIPTESIDKAKLCFLDYLAVYKRGLYEENSKIAIKTLLDLGYLKNDDVLSSGFINGVASHSLDLDDGHRLAFLHPGVVVFSTALAIFKNNNLLKEYNWSSKEFFESIVVSYEIAITLGKLVNPSHRNQGFHSTGTIGAIVAASVSSKLLKLDLEQTINSLAIATTQSAGLLESDHGGSMAKTLHVGNAVYSGLLSTFLAKNGFTGAESIIEGDEGFLNALVSFKEFENVDFKEFLNNNLGKFHINTVYLKKYPFCRHIHSSIDVILSLREELFKFEDSIDFIFNLIDEITVDTYKIASEHDDYSPKTKQALKQSLPYAVAIYLVCGDISLDYLDILIDNGLLEDNYILDYNTNDNIYDNIYEDVKVNLLNIKNLVKKVKINLNNELDSLAPEKRSSKIELKFSNDYAFGFDFKIPNEKEVFYPLGESENPLKWDDIIVKFSNLNPNYDLNKLEIIKVMDDKNIYDVLENLKND